MCITKIHYIYIYIYNDIVYQYMIMHMIIHLNYYYRIMIEKDIYIYMKKTFSSPLIYQILLIIFQFIAMFTTNHPTCCFLL